MNKIARVSFAILLAVFMITLALPGAVLASDGARASHDTPRFTDEVGLLTEQQVSELTAKLDEISMRQQFDVVVTVTHSTGGKSPRLYAADFFEDYGFGFGENRDGIILMLAMEYRDFAFVTTGYGLYAFTDPGQEYMEKLFHPYLRSDEFFEAFIAFADAADDLLRRARDGERYDYGNIPLTAQERQNARIWAAVISLVIAFIVPALVTAMWTNQLKSVRKKDFACDYIKQGSMVMNIQQDIFLHRNVVRTPRQQNTGSGSGGSFKSSSGRSFSGRSGKF
jgi:uncharacterized protein